MQRLPCHFVRPWPNAAATSTRDGNSRADGQRSPRSAGEHRLEPSRSPGGVGRHLQGSRSRRGRYVVHHVGQPDHRRQPARQPGGAHDARFGEHGAERQLHDHTSGDASRSVADVNRAAGSAPAVIFPGRATTSRPAHRAPRSPRQRATRALHGVPTRCTACWRAVDNERPPLGQPRSNWLRGRSFIPVVPLAAPAY